MNLPRGDGLIQVVPSPAHKGNACCHVCAASGEAAQIQLLQFNSPSRMRAVNRRAPGHVFVRICESCLTALASEWLASVAVRPHVDV